MKKTLSLLLCIILISCLVSCDLSAIWNSIRGTTESTKTTTTTTTTAPPVYETVTLDQIINREDVAYASLTVNNWENPAPHIFKYMIEDPEEILELLNILDLERAEYTDDEEYKTLFYLEYWESKKNNWKLSNVDHTLQYYITIILYYEDWSAIGICDFYPNNQTEIRIGHTYCSIDAEMDCWEKLMEKFVKPNYKGNKL